MCKKFKLDHTNEWYMQNPAPLLENNTHKLLYDFDTHTDHLISARRPDLIIINKKKRTCKIVDFAVPADHRIKLKQCEKKDKYLDLARELKKLWNIQVTIIPIVIMTWVQILDEAVCISHSTYTHGKGMNPIIISPAMGKIIRQTGISNLG